MKNTLFLGALIIVLGVSGFLLFAKQKSEVKNSVQTIPTITPTENVSTKTGITLAEITKHNSASDCWFTIEGKVYNVTPFIASGMHPGGDAILLGCGKDATSIFNKRPRSGTPHSQKARENLQNFYIGMLKN